MTERTARRLGMLGVVLILLTIPVYFLDLLLVAPNSKQCDGTGHEDLVTLVFGFGVLLWLAGVVLSGIAVSKKTSRFTGIGGLFIALLLAFVSIFGLFLLVAGECVPEPAALMGLG
jgi:hypothetical protein